MIRGAILAIALVPALAGCGGGGDDRGVAGRGLIWDEKPRLFVPQTLPDDRIVMGVVRNDSLRRVQVESKDVRLLDAEGRPVEASVAFLNGFLHGLYPPTREPELSDRELRRTGRRLRLTPGTTAPLTVSWRQGRGARRPVRIDWGGGTLPLPH